MSKTEVTRHATISAVARAAGVSTTTVSRYLNKKYDFMSLKTRNRIEQVIEELNYRPSSLARGLKSKKTHILGVVIADIENPFSSMLMKGINEICKQQDYHMLILNTDNSIQNEEEGIRSLIDHDVDALLINPTGYFSPIYNELKSMDLPVVLIDRQMDPCLFDTVTSNNYEITSEAAAYLIKNHYSKIFFVSEAIDRISTRQIRRKAIYDVLKKHGYQDEKDNTLIIDKNRPLEIKHQLIQLKQLHADEKIAFFAVNGQVLLTLLQIIHALRWSMPGDIGICGYDDWGWGELIPPGITVIQQEPYEMGKKSAELLIDRLEGKRVSEPELVQIPADLIIRGSTD
ncbi:LacI family DNA-binding transcriptional regulator [Sporolactobacillus sp. THM7-4]|nr:LacI family DNA-binding transcriptional regulator [Sporolactobacillus sp. THM7-4]